MRNDNHDRHRLRTGPPRGRTSTILELEHLETRIVPDSVVLSPSKDNTLYQSTSGLQSNGAGQWMFAGQTNQSSIRRSVLAFNVATGVPAGATINSVTLRLNMSKSITGNSNVSLRRLLADWGEGNSNAGAEEGMGAPSAPNDATWVHRFFNTSMWTSSGGDFSTTPSATASVGGVDFYTWGSTTQMVADVQSWVNTPSTNFGWILIGDETATSAKRFDTKENPTAANRPTLTIDFTSTPMAANTTTALVGAPAGATVFGQGLTLTATVTTVPPGTGTPSGTVTFKNGTTELGAMPLDASGVAILNTTTLPVGALSLTAEYGGSPTHNASVSAPLARTINAADTTTQVAAAPVSPTVFGQGVTFTATVTAVAPGAGVPTGQVIFKDGVTTLGTGTLNATGQATLSASTLSVGSHSITTSYNGSTSFNSSTSGALTHTVNQAASTTAVISSANPSIFGQNVTFTATVAAVAPGSGTPAGTVIFKDGVAPLATSTLNAAGMATFSTMDLSAGAHSITAAYVASVNYAGSTSGALSQTVNPVNATVRIVDDGDATDFSATAGFFPAPGQGFQNGVRFAGAGTGAETATWTFPGVEAGIYRVSATWTEFDNRATDAAYNITHGATDLGTVLVNQERAPNHFNANDGTWFNLGGIYTVMNTGTLTVRLTDAANEFVIADAVRVERLTMGPFQQVVDDGDVWFVATEGFVPFVGQGHGNDVAFAAGTGGQAAIWIFVLDPGTYRVSATWTEFENRATAAPYFLLDGDTFLDYAPVNQQLAPNDFREGGTAWDDLGGGVYSVSSGVLYVFLFNDADGFVIADALRVERLA